MNDGKLCLVCFKMLFVALRCFLGWTELAVSLLNKRAISHSLEAQIIAIKTANNTIPAHTNGWTCVKSTVHCQAWAAVIVFKEIQVSIESGWLAKKPRLNWGDWLNWTGGLNADKPFGKTSIPKTAPAEMTNNNNKRRGYNISVPDSKIFSKVSDLHLLSTWARASQTACHCQESRKSRVSEMFFKYWCFRKTTCLADDDQRPHFTTGYRLFVSTGFDCRNNHCGFRCCLWEAEQQIFSFPALTRIREGKLLVWEIRLVWIVKVISPCRLTPCSWSWRKKHWTVNKLNASRTYWRQKATWNSLRHWKIRVVSSWN